MTNEEFIENLKNYKKIKQEYEKLERELQKSDKRRTELRNLVYLLNPKHIVVYDGVPIKKYSNTDFRCANHDYTRRTSWIGKETTALYKLVLNDFDLTGSQTFYTTDLEKAKKASYEYVAKGIIIPGLRIHADINVKKVRWEAKW